MNKNTSSNAWYHAVERHIATLPLEQKHAFHAPASAEDCLLLIERAQLRNRKFDRLAHTLRPLVIPLKRFEGSIDTLVQTQSLFLSPIWGPLRCVLGLVSDRLASLASVTTLLERLVDPLRRFQDYERLFAGNVSLRAAIGCLYGDLIEFCSRVVSHCTKSVLRKNFGNFDRDVAEISAKIRHHWNEVDVVANAANLEEAKEARVAEERERALQRQVELNRWLAPANVDDDLHRLLAACQQGSCDWILQRPEFQALQEADTAFHALRITGHPGGGKSTAAAFLTTHLLSSGTNDTATSRRTVLYFFCKASDAEKTFASTVLRTFTFQLLQAFASLQPTIQQAFGKSGRMVLDSETETFAVFETLLSQAATTNHPIYIILDALDECRDAPALLQAVLDLPRKAALPLKVIVLGREDPDLKTHLQTCDSTLALHSHTEPLERYIESRVAKLSIIAHIPDSQRTSLVSDITTTSAGLWLFAAMLLDEIDRAPGPEEITRQLQSIPHGIAELYSSILRSRESRFSGTLQAQMAQQIYLWLDASAYLPPVMWMRGPGDALEDSMLDLLLQHASRSSHIFRPTALVRELCTPLVRLRLLHPGIMVHHVNGRVDDEDDSGGGNHVAEPFHQTVKAYLQWSISAPMAQVPESLRLRRLGHLHRGVAAVWYFTVSTHFQSELCRLRERPRDTDVSSCLMTFACALGRALDVQATDPTRVYEAEEEAAELAEQLVWFARTDRCLGFLEAVIIIGFAKTRDGLSLPKVATAPVTTQNERENSSVDPPAYVREATPVALRKLEAAHAALLADLAWALYSQDLPHLPSSIFQASAASKGAVPAMPVDFKERPLAQKIFRLVRKWRWLVWKPMAVSCNGFLFSPKR